MPAQPKAVLWDMDGTLADTEEDHWRAWRATMEAEGIVIAHEHFLATFGQRNDAVLPVWLGAAATPERMERISREKEYVYRQRVLEHGTQALDGAIELLKQLRRRGWRQAIASSAPRMNVDAVIEALGVTALFDAIAAAEDVAHGKPDPEVFLTAAARLGVPASRCVVLEDGAAGLEAARRAGMRRVGIGRNGAKLEADRVVRSLEEISPEDFDELLAAGQ